MNGLFFLVLLTFVFNNYLFSEAFLLKSGEKAQHCLQGYEYQDDLPEEHNILAALEYCDGIEVLREGEKIARISTMNIPTLLIVKTNHCKNKSL